MTRKVLLLNIFSASREFSERFVLALLNISVNVLYKESEKPWHETLLY